MLETADLRITDWLLEQAAPVRLNPETKTQLAEHFARFHDKVRNWSKKFPANTNPVSANLSGGQAVIEIFSGYGAGYIHNISCLAYPLQMQALLDFLALPAGEHTLASLGCGPGVMEISLAHYALEVDQLQGLRVSSIDAAAGMVKTHKSLLAKFTEEGLCCPAQPLPNLTVGQGDFSRLPFETAEVQHALVSFSLEWVPQWRPAVAEISRILEPETGYAYLFLPHAPATAGTMHGKPYVIGTFGLHELLDCLERKDLSIAAIRKVHATPLVAGSGKEYQPTGWIAVIAQKRGDNSFVGWRTRAEEQKVDISQWRFNREIPPTSMRYRLS